MSLLQSEGRNSIAVEKLGPILVGTGCLLSAVPYLDEGRELDPGAPFAGV